MKDVSGVTPSGGNPTYQVLPQEWRAKYDKAKTFEEKQQVLADYQATLQQGDRSVSVFGTMKSKKEYKADRKAIQTELYTDIHDEGNLTDYTQRMAKKQAKQQVQVQRAADRVLSSVYFTPAQKEEYKSQKAALEKQGLRPVLLTEDDMELLRAPEFAEAFNADGSLDSEKLKLIASQRLGSDNTLEMDERRAEISDLKDGTKVTHKKARQAKNLYKHLGFDYDKDLTETKRAAAIVGSTLLGSTVGAGIGAATSGTTADQVKEIVLDGGVDQGGGVGVAKLAVKIAGQHVNRIPTGVVAGATGGLIGGVLVASQINDLDKSKDILNSNNLTEFACEAYANPAEAVKQIKGKRNQLMMQRAIQLAQEKGISQEDFTAMLIRAEGSEEACEDRKENGDSLTEKELLGFYNMIQKYEKQDKPVVDTSDEQPVVDTSDEQPVVDTSDDPPKTPEGNYHEHVEEGNYTIRAKGNGMYQTVAAVYGVREGSKEHAKLMEEMWKVNPGLKNRQLNVGDKVNLPEFEIEGTKYTPDLDAKPNDKKPAKTRLPRYEGSRRTVYAPGTKEEHVQGEQTFDNSNDAKQFDKERKTKPQQ